MENPLSDCRQEFRSEKFSLGVGILPVFFNKDFFPYKELLLIDDYKL